MSHIFQNTYSPARIAEILPGTQLFAGPDETAQLVHYFYDSRLIFTGKQAVFLMLPGPHRKGEQFLAEAYARGVRVFWGQAAYPEQYPGCTWLVSKAPLAALQELAQHHRETFPGRVIGITGSNGKTITKEWLATLLGTRYSVVASPRSFNSQLGVPLSLLRLRAWHEWAIIEAGISQPGEMARLQKVIQPDWGIFTHFGAAHDEGFATRKEKLREKMLLFQSAKRFFARDQVPGLKALLPEDCRVELYGIAEEAQTSALEAGVLRVGEHRLTTPLEGNAARDNLTLAVAVALAAGVPQAQLQQTVPTLQPVELRTELITDHPEITLINDTYNADPDSLYHALDLLASHTEQPGHRLILSDLEHQGERTAALQKKLLAEAAQRFGAENLWLVGPVFRELVQEYPKKQRPRAYATTAALLNALKPLDFRHSTVLVKGARKFRLEQVVERLNRRPAATRLEIDLNAIKHNLDTYRQRLPGARPMVMMKAAAYGGGGWQLARELFREGVRHFAVAFTNEAVELREKGITAELLVLSPQSEQLNWLWEYELTPAVGSLQLLETLGKRRRNIALHLEFDTGMRRHGFVPAELPRVLETLAHYPTLRPKAVFSHLAAADDPQKDTYTQQQLADFQSIYEQLQPHYPNLERHILNSSGALRFPQAVGDYFRLGIGLYGLSSPADAAEALVEAVSLRSTLMQLHRYPAGAFVGYGCSQTLERESLIGTVPLGYADGLPRHLSNGKGGALVAGQWCPIVGKVCMDLTMLDLTDLPTPPQTGQEVVFFGWQGGEFLSLREQAAAAGTIPYELLVRVPPRVRRTYRKE